MLDASPFNVLLRVIRPISNYESSVRLQSGMRDKISETRLANPEAENSPPCFRMFRVVNLRIKPNVAAADGDDRSAPHRDRTRIACRYAYSLPRIPRSDRDKSSGVILDAQAVGNTTARRCSQQSHEPYRDNPATHV